jgi:lipid-A-disaccharide synthase-like uncharacterized protein
MIQSILAATWFGETHRFFGLDWSYLMIVGFAGNLIFGARFYVQWIASERKKQSIIPISFWYLSLIGTIILSFYFICRREPIGILSNAPNIFVYLRNLALIRKSQNKQPEVSNQEPQ